MRSLEALDPRACMKSVTSLAGHKIQAGVTTWCLALLIKVSVLTEYTAQGGCRE